MQSNNDKKPGLSWSTPTQSSAQSPLSSSTKSLPAPQPSGNSLAKYIGMFAGGVIVGVLLAWGWAAAMNRGSVASTASSTVASTEVGSETSSNTNSNSSPVLAQGSMNESLDVSSPQKAGESVDIANASITKPTWIVVYDDSAGKPGNALGAKLFFTSGPGIVTLLRSTVAGKTYLVGKYVDNGDHKYSKSTDTQVLNSDGTPELTSFKAN